MKNYISDICNFISNNKKKFIFGFLILFVVFFVVIILVKSPRSDERKDPANDQRGSNPSTKGPALTDGEKLSGSNCTGEGSVVLGTSPMKSEDFSFLIPYGLMVGAHVTPIDHMYFSPTDFNSAPDTYDVVAMADSKIVNIEYRSGDYRLVFMHTCTFFTYYDLLTSLAPDIKEVFEENSNGNYTALDFDVKEGQLIGRIGGQTLDFAVWDMNVVLDGFIVPEHYDSEIWKIHTSNPFDYITDDLDSLFKEKLIRSAEPIQGKIDYDEEGKLIGNWFVEDTNGYGGGESEYYKTHLSIVPEHIDPTAFLVSGGNIGGEPLQFAIPRDAIKPDEVTVETGPVKYPLYDFEYLLPNGESWDRDSVAKDIKLEPAMYRSVMVLFQLLEARKLKVEFFTNVEIDEVTGFTENAVIYER